MGALTDEEIMAALPLEGRQKITNAFEALSQCRPSAAEQAILFRVAHTLKLQPTDTIFSTLAAMHFYLEMYKKIPEKISKVGNDIRTAGSEVEVAIRTATQESLAEHAKAFREQLKATQADGVTPAGTIGSKGVSNVAATAAGNADAKFRAARWSAGVVALCAIVFGGAGYLVRAGADAVSLSAASNRIAEAEKKALTEVEELKRAGGWAMTDQGRRAKKFFENGAGEIVATCNQPDAWEIVTKPEGRFCVPRKRPISGGEEHNYGWKIP